MAVPLRHSSVKFQNYTCLSKWNCKKNRQILRVLQFIS